MSKNIGLVKSKLPYLIIDNKTSNEDVYSLIILRTAHKVFFLNKPLKCKLTKDGKYWHIINSDLGMEVMETSKEEAKIQFASQFEAFYSAYVLEDAQNLTPKAITIKNKMNNYINMVYIYEG